MPTEIARRDPARERLLAAVALGEGFQFHIVAAQGPRQVRELLRGLVEALPARRGGGTARGVYVAPYESLPRERALEADALIGHVDAALAGLRPATAAERLIVALDATPASAEDEAAWRRVFRHMNEQRNGFVRQLDATFVLCLPAWLEAPFAHEAADFWSIRGVSVTLAVEMPPDAVGMSVKAVTPQRSDQWTAPTDAELAAARASVVQAPHDEWRQRRLMILLNLCGDELLNRRGDSAAALTAYEEAYAIAMALTARDPANPERQRDLSVSHIKLGDVQQAQGVGSGALAAYRQGLSIHETLAARDAANTEWQRDLSVSHNKIGEVLQAQGDGPGALAAFRQSLAIRETLAARDPANTEWQRDLSISYNRVGEVLQAQGDRLSALAVYRQGLAIAETLAARDAANTELQRDLSISYNRIGEVLQAQGDGPGALAAYRKGLAIRETLSAHDPANAGWQRDLIVSHVKIAEASGDKTHLSQALRIAEAMQAKGILAPRDTWMLDELKQRLAP